MSSRIEIAPPWTSGLKPGSALNCGSSASARLILTVPERDRHCSMSWTNSAGRCRRSIWRRNVIWGWQVVTTSGASNSSPPLITTPVTRPSRTVTFSTGALTRTLAPKASAERRIASETAPMPPSGMPQDATWPSVSCPVEWCMSTYAVPGAKGPAQVPMMPLIDSIPFTTSLSNQRSRRSAQLMVKSRVMSPTVRSSARPRFFKSPEELRRVHQVAGLQSSRCGAASRRASGA